MCSAQPLDHVAASLALSRHPQPPNHAIDHALHALAMASGSAQPADPHSPDCDQRTQQLHYLPLRGSGAHPQRPGPRRWAAAHSGGSAVYAAPAGERGYSTPGPGKGRCHGHGVRKHTVASMQMICCMYKLGPCCRACPPDEHALTPASLLPQEPGTSAAASGPCSQRPPLVRLVYSLSVDTATDVRALQAYAVTTAAKLLSNNDPDFKVGGVELVMHLWAISVLKSSTPAPPLES